MKKIIILLGIIIVVGIAIFISQTQKTKNDCLGKPQNDPSVSNTEIDSTQTAVPEMFLNLNKDSFAIKEFKIKKNQNLSDILVKYDIDYSKIDLIAKKSKEIYDVRKFKVGNSYYILNSTKDTTHLANYFVYKIDPINYVVYNLEDSVSIYKYEKKIEIQECVESGKITSSLWNAMKDKNMNPYIAIKLSDIFAWTIDFFDIKQGDQFGIIYEKLFVDGEQIGIGKIKMAELNHEGKSYKAYLFDYDDHQEYFDQDGNSLRKAFLKAPLKFSRISSRFSYNRHHPVLKIRRPHLGVDYAAPTGTPIHAVGDGTIIAKAYQPRGGGNYLKIKHNSIYTTVYMHMSRYAKGMKVGKRVSQGDLIGYVGATGIATGPHLDFRVFKNGQAIDPLKMDAPSAKPVVDSLKSRFLASVEVLSKEFNQNSQTVAIKDSTESNLQ